MRTREKSRKQEPRRAMITSTEERLIHEYSTERYPNMGREELAEKMVAEIDWPTKEPAVEVLVRKISHYRQLHRQRRVDSPLDQPWHMGTLELEKYPQTPEGLAAVIAAYRFAAQHDATLTIRQAKWIGRLHAVPKRMWPELTDKELLPLLIYWALNYASTEVWSEVSKDPFVTTPLDYWLVTDYPPPPREGYRFEAMAVDSLKKLASSHATRRLREWLEEPRNKEKVRRRKEIVAILQNPKLAEDQELGERLDSLVREDTREIL